MTRILVVEDELDLRTIVADVLADSGYAVTTARNGSDALRAIDQQRPDVILLDLVMPGMDGWEFLDCIRGSRAMDGVPIGIFSAASGAQAAVPGGTSCLIPKPFDVEDLLSAVEVLSASQHAYVG